MNIKNNNDLWICSRVTKSIACGMELVMCLPVIGWIVSTLTGITVTILFLMHAVSFLFTIGANAKKTGNLVGLIASFASIVPVIGWMLHIIVSIILLREIKQMKKAEKFINSVYVHGKRE